MSRWMILKDGETVYIHDQFHPLRSGTDLSVSRPLTLDDLKPIVESLGGTIVPDGEWGDFTDSVKTPVGGTIQFRVINRPNAGKA